MKKKQVKNIINNYDYMPTILAMENTIISSNLMQSQKDILLNDLEKLKKNPNIKNILMFSIKLKTRKKEFIKQIKGVKENE